MIWQRTARWIVAAIGIGAAVAIVVYSRNRPAPPQGPASISKIDPNVTLLGGAGQREIRRAGKSPVTVDYGSLNGFEDGRWHFERVVIKGLEESRFIVEAKVMDTGTPLAGSDNPQKLYMHGGVKLTTDDGLELTTETATWDESTSQLEIPGAVAFKKGRLSGTGIGASYDRQTDAFTLLDKAQAHVDVDKEGHGGADLSSTKMTLVRGQHTVQLIDKAKIVGETQTLTARDATVIFKDDDSVAKYLELRGAARVVTNSGTTSNRPTMNADNITMSFYEDGVTLQHATLTGQGVLNLAGTSARSVRSSYIDFYLASDGQTVTGLTAKDRVVVTSAPTATTAGRTITSSTLVATGDEKKGLTSATFEGSPRFEEMEPVGPQKGAQTSGKPVRVGTSFTLVLTLAGQLDAIESAEFRQNAKFTDGDVTAEADIARYDEAKGQLHLIPNAKEPRRPSHVRTPDMTVDATTIDLDTKTDDMDARGSVTTRSKKSSGPVNAGSLFSGDEPVLGSAETLKYTRKTGAAVYTGTPRAQALLRQGEGGSEVSGDRIEYSDTTKNLNASGTVSSRWQLESSSDGGAKKVKTQRVAADTLAYDETKRTATYKGAPVRVTTDEGNVEGSTVTFLLADESRELRTMRSETAVWAKLSDGYEAVGHVLVYDAKAETYTIEGRVNFFTALVKSPPDDPAKDPRCTWTEGMRLRLDRKTNKVDIPGQGQAPREIVQKDCSIPLPRRK